PDLPLVQLVHPGGLVAAADGVHGVGVHAADVGEVAVLHDRGGLAGGRVGDLGEQLGGGVRGAGRGGGVRRGGGPGGHHDGGGAPGGHHDGDGGPGDGGRGQAGERGGPAPGPCFMPVFLVPAFLVTGCLAEFGHQVLLEDLLPVRRQVPVGGHRQPPGQFVM